MVQSYLLFIYFIILIFTFFYKIANIPVDLLDDLSFVTSSLLVCNDKFNKQ